MTKSRNAKHRPPVGHKLCQATTAKGKPCKRQALPGERYCHAHHPDRKDRLREAGKKGGSVSRRPELPLMDTLNPQESRELIAGAIAGVLTGTITESAGRCVGYLLSVDIKVKEINELEARIAMLETDSEESK
jgi:hypothetical protein